LRSGVRFSEDIEAVDVGADENLELKETSAMVLVSELVVSEELGTDDLASGLFEPCED
jgi:hypothetical protein